IVGYDPERDEVVYHEPAENDGAYRRMKRTRMLKLWPLVYDPASWTLIRFRLEPDPAAPRPAPIPKVHGHTPPQYAEHVLKLKEKLGPGYSVAIEPPFVVAGDAPEERVREYAEGLVYWAKAKLSQDFFQKEPEKILDVLLFSNARTYRKKAIDLFG